MEEGDAVGVAAVLAADAETEVGTAAPSALDRRFHPLADAFDIDRLEGAPLDDLAPQVLGQEPTLGVVAREAERGLGQIEAPPAPR